LQFQRGTQLLVLSQAYFGFAKGPVCVAHQAQHRPQLRLGELMLTEARALGRQNPRAHLQRHASKGQQSDLAHRPSCFHQKTPQAAPCGPLETPSVPRMSTEPNTLREYP
jgi:hypothetical protein